MQNHPAQARVLPPRLGEEEVGFAGALLSRPQACLQPEHSPIPPLTVLSLHLNNW